ncbi:hypothetical protein BDW59DRAFT_105425 [Aspergillus cavernicola]|uniref:Uncharacterized protein n=1 Tax=Aspergillus cavernicola TaxID=176166 RepID=A0ABR4IXJ3_9EURO
MLLLATLLALANLGWAWGKVTQCYNRPAGGSFHYRSSTTYTIEDLRQPFSIVACKNLNLTGPDPEALGVYPAEDPIQCTNPQLAEQVTVLLSTQQHPSLLWVNLNQAIAVLPPRTQRQTQNAARWARIG